MKSILRILLFILCLPFILTGMISGIFFLSFRLGLESSKEICALLAHD